MVAEQQQLIPPTAQTMFIASSLRLLRFLGSGEGEIGQLGSH